MGKHLGSKLDEFLDEDGLLAECEAMAVKRVIAWQFQQMNKQQGLGSGNLFADIGVNNPKEALVKARLAHVIARAIETRGVTQSEVAGLLGIDQPEVSNLVRGKLSGFSIDRLFRFLTLLGS